MKLEKKRIFIKQLPSQVNQSDLESTFNDYGKVTSIEIKSRSKDTTFNNKSQHFAYINIEIDDFKLQKCFNDFANNSWFGEYVQLQIAKENFLERLKREREEETATSTLSPSKATTNAQENVQKPLNLIIGNGCAVKRIYKSDSSDGDDDNEEEEKTDLIIKNNKFKAIGFHNGGLKIDGIGNQAAEAKVVIEEEKINNSESNNKRIKSLNQMIKGYKQQKSMIQAALSNIDYKPRNKIVFDEEARRATKISNKKHNNNNSLFGTENSDDENYNFDVKKQFEGKQGQKLLELQTKFKNDKRFNLDKRFIDDTLDDSNVHTFDDEKTKQYHILEEVLGKPVVQKNELVDNHYRKKSMLRYDPSQPEHAKYEVKNTEPTNNNSIKRNRRKLVVEEEEVSREIEEPSVSKVIFYKVTDSLRETFEKKETFSLLNTFGNVEDKDEEEDESPKTIKLKKNNKFTGEQNPFRYESSDDDDENEEIVERQEEIIVSKTKEKQPNSWFEPFFFKDDDYRLQEGFDFMQRLASEEDTEFVQVRRDVKKIVKAKVKNNLRKNRPFKKKLGGNRRKQRIRIKKAVKR